MTGQQERKYKQQKLSILKDRTVLYFRFWCQSLAVDCHPTRIPLLFFDVRFVTTAK